MNYQLRSRVGQQQPTDLLEEVHDPTHLKKIKDWVKASKSPQYMRIIVVCFPQKPLMFCTQKPQS